MRDHENGADAGGRYPFLRVAASFQEARDLLPDGAHERLYAVHGVRLSQAARAAILEQGFPAWG